MAKVVISFNKPILPNVGNVEIIPLENPQEYIKTAKNNGAETFKDTALLGTDADEVIVVVVNALVYRVVK